MSTSVNYFHQFIVCLMLTIPDNDNYSTQGMLRNKICSVRGIVIMKANVIITSPQSVFHNFIVLNHRATRYTFLSPPLLVYVTLLY